MNNFEELGVGKKFILGLNELNIMTTTAIQNKVIPLLINPINALLVKEQP